MGADRHRRNRQILAMAMAVLFLALSLVVGFVGSLPGDERILVEFDARVGTRLDDAMVAVGAVSNTLPLLAGSAVVAAVLVVKRRRHDVCVFLAVVVVGVVGNWILKHVVGRPRPDVRPSPEDLSKFSFPSGHAANSMAVAVALLLIARSRRSRISFLAVGTVAVGLVGFSRIVIGVHYPSDILGAWLWVGAWAALVWSWEGPSDRCTRRP